MVAAKTNVYVVDDDPAVRDSLKLQLESAGLTVKAFRSAQEFLSEAGTLPPGCLISDVRMPGIDGIQLLQRLADLRARFPAIMITGQGDRSVTVRAIKAGAIDCVEKPFSDDAILGSVRCAQASLARSCATATDLPGQRMALLSACERAVLERLVAGLPNKTIGSHLGISTQVVEMHRARMMDKLEVRSLAQVVRVALAAGIDLVRETEMEP